MSRLYLRIGLGVLAACVVDIIVILILLNQVQFRDRQGFHEMILGQGLGWMQYQFDESDQDKWPAMLRVARKKSSAELDILTAADAQQRADTSLSTSEPTFTGHPPAPPRVYLPLKNGSYYLIVSPSPPHLPPNDFLLFPIAFIVILTIIAAVIVGLPLNRRLTNLRRAISELGQGNWNIRLDAESEGALREVAVSLNQTATRLHALFQERETLLQAVSHEIGTPLARMRFQLELIKERNNNPELLNRLDSLADDLNQLDELSTELVGWVEADSRGLQSIEFELRSVLEPLIELESPEEPTELRIDLEINGELRLTADLRHFQRAIENILRNAIRYANRQIIVSARQQAEQTVIEIQDDGPGIPQEYRERVFEPFFCIDPSRSRENGGMGIGLAIAKRILEAHGGTIIIDTSAQGGARVTTLWPNETKIDGHTC